MSPDAHTGANVEAVIEIVGQVRRIEDRANGRSSCYNETAAEAADSRAICEGKYFHRTLS